jgi:GTP 3',8-cyclase
MIDPFGRTITYLRVSVTDRCDFRCVYCMGEDVTFLPRTDLLSLEELARVCAAFVGRGVRKLRITGGEPMVRRDIMHLFHDLAGHLHDGSLDELTLTTNGGRLTKFAAELAACGVRRINVSLDTLDAGRFTDITRSRGRLETVLEGLDAAVQAGLQVKINTVALKGVNDDEFNRLVAWCGERGFDLTFIETMPLGEFSGDLTACFLPTSEVRKQLERTWTLVDSDASTGGPASYVTVAETGRKVGFISPLSHNFCATCNRVRLTCTGQLYLCLGQEDSVDLSSPLRASEGDGPLLAAIDSAIGRKPEGHSFVAEAAGQRPVLARTMNRTGG